MSPTTVDPWRAGGERGQIDEPRRPLFSLFSHLRCDLVADGYAFGSWTLSLPPINSE